MSAAQSFAAMVLLGCLSVAAVADETKKTGHDRAAAIDEIAQSVFAAADRNHNHVLNKSEFEDAQNLLDEEIRKLGQQGAIGKPAKASIDSAEKDRHAAASANAAANKLSRSNKISQAEFTYYVHAAIDEADVEWRQLHAQADAQRKAAMMQRMMAPRRGRPRYVYPLPYGY